MYVTRETVLPRIKKRRRAVFKSLAGDTDDSTERMQLTIKEFITISIVHHMHINHLGAFIEMVLFNSAILVCIFYLLLTALLGMPLSMLFTFMSSYSKKSFLAIWDCVPLLEGIGYSIAAIRFTSECYSILIGASCMTVIIDILRRDLKYELSRCKFQIKTSPTSMCIPMVNTDPVKNCTQIKTYTALQYYFRFDVLRYNYDPNWHEIFINHKLVINAALIWLMVFVFAILGLKNLRRITVNLQIGFTGLMMILMILAVGKVNFKRHKWLYSARKTTAPFKFWVDIILHASETTALGNLIWLGSMKPDRLSPKYAAIMTTPIKLLVLLLIVFSTTIGVQESMVQYKIMNGLCFKPSGTEVLMVLIPDLLFRFDVWKTPTLFWYISMLFFCILATLYTTISLVDALTEKFKSLQRWSLVVCLVLCVTGFLLTLPLTCSVGSVIMAAWRHCGLTVQSATMALLINLAVFFVYSTRKIIDDYIFTFGAPPEAYWVTLWKSAPIFTIFAFIFALTFQSRHFTTLKANVYVIWLSYLQCSSVLLPVFVILIGRCCKNIKRRTVDHLTRPALDWGPANNDDKIARLNFFPHRDVRYRNPILSCKHKCAVSDDVKYMEEIEIQNVKFQQALKEMQANLDGKED